MVAIDIIDDFTVHCLICAINSAQNYGRINLSKDSGNATIESVWLGETVREWDALQSIKMQLYKQWED